MPARSSPELMYSTNIELEEVDVTENPIDGMGAIKFTDEEDCGFFGEPTPRASIIGTRPCRRS